MVSVRMDEATHPRISTLAPAVLSERLHDMVIAAAMLRGQSLGDDQIAAISGFLADEIRAEFPQLTLAEIGKAIKDGIFEKYGEVYGINAVSLFRMVRGYVESEERQQLYKKVDDMKNQRVASQQQKNAEFLAAHPEYKKSTLGVW